MFLNEEEKRRISQIRDEMLLPLLDKFADSDFTNFDNCLAFFKEYKPIIQCFGEATNSAFERLSRLQGINDSLSSELSSESSDDELIMKTKKLEITATELNTEIYALMFTDIVKQKSRKLFETSAPICGVDLKYGKHTEEKYNKYIEPAMTMEEYKNNPDQVKKFFAQGKSITMYNAIDRTVKTKTIETVTCKISFDDKSDITFKTLDDQRILKDVRDAFNQRVDELTNTKKFKM